MRTSLVDWSDLWASASVTKNTAGTDARKFICVIRDKVHDRIVVETFPPFQSARITKGERIFITINVRINTGAESKWVLRNKPTQLRVVVSSPVKI